MASMNRFIKGALCIAGAPLCCSLVFGLTMPERSQPEFYPLLYVNAVTRVGIFGSDRNPLDSLDKATIYDARTNDFQSFSFDLFNGPRKKVGFSGGAELWQKYGNAEHFYNRPLDTGGFRQGWRAQTINLCFRDIGALSDAAIGRQNAYTGFHYYKIDGARARLKIGDKTSVSGFIGTRVDSAMGFKNIGNLGNSAEFLQIEQKFGVQSHFRLNYEHAQKSVDSVDGVTAATVRGFGRSKLSASDVGGDLLLATPGSPLVRSSFLATIAEKSQLDELRFRADYPLTAQLTPRVSYDYHAPGPLDSITVYYFNMFKYQKVMAGARWQPLLQHYLFIDGDYAFVRMFDLNIHTVEAGLRSSYFNLRYSTRFGDLSGASLIDASAEYPVHNRLTMGAGYNFAKMDIYYSTAGVSDFRSMYGFMTLRPWKEASLLVRVEDRTDAFVKHDTRVFVQLCIGYTNQRSPIFREGRQ